MDGRALGVWIKNVGMLTKREYQMKKDNCVMVCAGCCNDCKELCVSECQQACEYGQAEPLELCSGACNECAEKCEKSCNQYKE